MNTHDGCQTVLLSRPWSWEMMTSTPAFLGRSRQVNRMTGDDTPLPRASPVCRVHSSALMDRGRNSQRGAEGLPKAPQSV